MVNPCFCGCSLKKATLAVAVIDMIIAALSAFLILGLGGVVITNAPSGEEAESQTATAELLEMRERDEFLFGTPVPISLAVFGGSLLLCAVRFYLAIVLKRGSDEENVKKCTIWIVSSCFFMLLSVGSIVMNYLLGKDALENFGNVVGIVFAIFGMWVVYEFIKEIQSGKIQRTDSVV